MLIFVLLVNHKHLNDTTMKKQFKIEITNTTAGQISGYVSVPGNDVEFCTLAEAGFNADMTYADILEKYEDEEVELFIVGNFDHDDFVEFFDWNPAEDETLAIDPSDEGFYYEVHNDVATVIIGNQRFGSFSILTGEMC